MKSLIYFVALLLCNAIYAQKNIQDPTNDMDKGFLKDLQKKLEKYQLSDLRESLDSFVIRFWGQHKVVTLNSNNYSENSVIIHTFRMDTKRNQDGVYNTFNIENGKARIILDSILLLNPFELKGHEYRGIDGSITYIEIATKNSYKLIHFWSPRAINDEDSHKAVKMFEILGNNLPYEYYHTLFFNNLEAGSYYWGMSRLDIDKLLGNEIKKTDLYLKIEQVIKEKFIIKDSTHYPLIIINYTLSKIADLNKYTNEDIKEIEIIQPNTPSSAAYGSNGYMRGVIKILTK